MTELEERKLLELDNITELDERKLLDERELLDGNELEDGFTPPHCDALIGSQYQVLIVGV